MITGLEFQSRSTGEINEATQTGQVVPKDRQILAVQLDDPHTADAVVCSCRSLARLHLVCHCREGEENVRQRLGSR